jgi:glutaredoxin 2
MPLPEFATSSAIAYFTHKKELSIGPFAKALERTPQLVAEAHDHLGLLNEWMRAAPFVWGPEISIDDFHLFASLRVLTTCDQIRFPSQVGAYVQFMSERAGVPLHWEFAC